MNITDEGEEERIRQENTQLMEDAHGYNTQEVQHSETLVSGFDR
jgi:hypothetical protein|tara:strand:- start:200 stop:331 length:132 start_codon:yes stop_codon:yes gene_type:complete